MDIVKDFYTQLTQALKENKISEANKIVLYRLGTVIADDKSKFVQVMNKAGIPVTINTPDNDLASLFLLNAPKNKSLLMNVSYLINLNKKSSGVDGMVNNNAVKSCYKLMSNNFDGWANEDYFNADATVVAGVVTSVSDLLKSGVSLAQDQLNKDERISTNQQNIDIQNKQLSIQADQANKAILQGIINSKQAQLTSKQAQADTISKTTKTGLIIGGIVVAIGLIVVAVVMIKKRNSK